MVGTLLIIIQWRSIPKQQAFTRICEYCQYMHFSMNSRVVVFFLTNYRQKKRGGRKHCFNVHVPMKVTTTQDK